MRTLTLAIYDLETSNNPFIETGTRGNWPLRPFDEIGFAVGVVRFVTFWRNEKGHVTRARRAENVHFSPVALLDDLLRPWVHAVVAYNGVHFDNRVLTAAAVWPDPGVFLETGGAPPTEDQRAQWAQHLARCGLPASSAQFIADHDGAHAARYLARVELHREHSRLILPGAVGLAAPREAVLAALDARTFDPLRVLGELTGHPHVAKLDYFRQGMKLKPFLIDGAEVTGADVPRLWQEGAVWSVVDKCRADVNVLEELLHHAFFGGASARLLVPTLNRTFTDSGGNLVEVPIEAFLSPHADSGAENRYRIPTADWWDRVSTLARTSRPSPGAP